MLNSAKSVKALEDYRKLFTYNPPGWGNAFFVETNTAFAQGQVAMAMNYFAFFPSLVNEATNPHAKSTGFFANPHGPERRRLRRARRPGHLDRVATARTRKRR